MGNSVTHSFIRSSLPSKRKKISEDRESGGYDIEDSLFTPKRRKLMSTSKYIYKTLFEEGQGNDVKIIALNKEWNLHRIYLSQSPYFNSMFNGLWVETSQKEIRIGIEDENITSEALHKVFGSLYQDEINIEPSEAVPVLAAATLLQLEDLIQQSVEVMKESINMDTVISYHEASELYGLKEIKSLTLDWLYKNMVVKLAASPVHLQQLSSDLMVELISSPHLVVVQTEFSLYIILKQWVFLRENLTFVHFDTLSSATEEYFNSFSGSMPFLSTNCGCSYQKAFRALRLKHLVVHHVDMEVIESDNIIPVDWFMPIFKIQWYHMLRVEQGADKGPNQVSDEEFMKDCVRCGRVLNTDTQHSWRWTGFNFGFDIVIFYARGTFKLRRYLKTENEVRLGQNPYDSLSLRTFKLRRYLKTENEVRLGQNPYDSLSLRSEKRHLMYRFGVFSLNKDGKIISKNETSIKTVSLTENEQVTVLNFQTEMKFPLLISANFLLTTPLQSTDEIMPSIRHANEGYV